MNKPVLTPAEYVTALRVQPYERYNPTAFNDSLSILEKINKMIYQLNLLGKISNDLTEQWNNLIEWILGSGLNEIVAEEIQKKIDDGTFDNLFDSILGNLSDLTTIDKTTIVNAINEVNALATKSRDDIGNIDNLITNEKNNLVDAINELKIQSDMNEQSNIMIAEATGFGIISGLKVTQQPILGMSVDIGNATEPNIIHMPNGNRYVIDSVSLGVDASDPILNRKDIFFVNNLGEIKYLAGTPSATPIAPLLPMGAVYLAEISVVATDTTINNTDITDKRPLKSLRFLDTNYKDNLVGAINEVLKALNDFKTSIMIILGDKESINVIDKTSFVTAINEVIKNIGSLDDLNFTDKSSIVNALNLCKKLIGDSYDELVKITGDINLLETTNKTDLVSAINEVLDKLDNDIGDVLNVIGNLSVLKTSYKADIVGAINEVVDNLKTEIDDVMLLIGDISTLTTTDKTNLVKAINEIVKNIGDVSSLETSSKVIVPSINELKARLDDIGTVVDKSLTEIYNVVTTFGADKTGVIDSTLFIQNAIDDLVQYGGGVVFFPKGTYLVKTIRIPSNVTLLGTGSSSIIKQSDASTNHMIVSANASTNIAVKDLKLDGNAGVRLGGTFVLHFLNNVDVLLENLVVTNSLGVALDVRESRNVTVINCRVFKNKSHGISLNKCVYSTISSCYVHENDIGIYLENACRFSVVTGNLMFKNKRSGFSIPLESPSTDNTISNNIARENGYHGFEVQGSTSVVDSNVALNNGTVAANQGILINCNDAIVSNNIAFFNKGVGIDLGDCNSITVSNNHCIRNGVYGIEINSSHAVTCIGNIVSANSRDFPNVYSGIIVYADELFGGTSENVIITGNRCTNLGTGNQAFGIDVGINSINVIASNNDVTDGGATANIGLSGIGYIVKDNIGFINSLITSKEFDVTTMGQVDIVVPLTMNVNANQDKIFTTLTATTANDFRLSSPIIVAVTHNTCTIRVYVDTPSPTPNAKAKINVSVVA